MEPKDLEEEPKARITSEEFLKRYQLLCDETGFRISVKPAFLSRDDGTWSVVLQTLIEKLPK